MPSSGSPLGSTPFGSGTPSPAAAPPSQLSQFSRYLNPGSGDFEVDPDTGQLKQMPAVRQRFLLLARTVRGSAAAMPEFGIRMPAKIDGAFAHRMRASVRDAARQMTDIEKIATVDDVLVEQLSSGRVQVTIVYTDLTTGQTGSVNL